ncbi:ABC transporter permease [Limimaricola sp. G21655-S1]|uniref:ABC transporter permease n=1 Tax=Limimaricola sp. G21655-S1 TaxID=3014768 RepID=UPI0022B06DB9|nr:ABC transporter permease [Limimaricola sp. G21655-S1]MCZ4262111.1 ABC transporter permease [Limimaricola sp. G21655-S1]
MSSSANTNETRSWLWRVNPTHAAGHAGLLVGLLVLWETGSRTGLLDPLILPAPTAILAALWQIAVVDRLLWGHFGITLYEAMAGFVIGSAIGIALAIGAALWEPFRRYSAPYVVGLQVTPRIALAPIVIAWLGFGTTPNVAIAALLCFFPPFLNTMTGLLDVDRDLQEMFRSLRASKRQVFTQLMLPTALPYMMAGLKTAMTMALIGAIVGEFISASEGLGVLMHRFTFQLNMAATFAVLVALTLMGLLLFALMEWVDNRIVFWRHDERMQEISRKRAAREAGRAATETPGTARVAPAGRT